MRLVSTPHTDFLRSLAAEIMHNYGRGRAIVAIDGTDASGRVEFADQLAAVLTEDDRHVFRASMRYFQRAGNEQDGSEPDPQVRLYRSGFDDSALRRVLVEPFRMGGSAGFVLEHRDPTSGEWIQPSWRTAPHDAVLVIDGQFLNRSDVHGLWSYSVLLETETAEETETDAAAPAEAAYLSEVSPRESVTAVIDNTDPAAPKRRFLDRC
jgi:uridine kinase